MRVVIDANVVMAMLIRPGKPIGLLFRNDIEAFAPELLLKELINNQETITKKSKLKEEEIGRLLDTLKKKILFIPERSFLTYKRRAAGICPDKKDITYFALALSLNCAIWTNEKKLQNQDKIKIYTTHELLGLFNT